MAKGLSLGCLLGGLLGGLLWAGHPPAPSPSATPSSKPAAPVHAIDEALDGPKSPVLHELLQLIPNWPAGRKFCHPENDPLEIQMVNLPTKDHPYYVGFKKCMIVNAPINAVASVLDDVRHYGDLFPGDTKVHVASEDGNLTVLAWERKIPVIFVPNVKYEISYLSDESSPEMKIYRSQLKKGDRLRYSDAIIILESRSPTQTLFSNYEYYEADYGLGLFGINAMGPGAVWKESLRGSYLSLLSIRYKAEHPDWDYGQIARAREDAIRGVSLENVPY